MMENSDTQINYIILAGEKDDITPLSIPNNMHHEILRWLPNMPYSVVHHLGGSMMADAVINK